MSHFESESNPDSEWDDSWESVWNEHDWEVYLANEKDQVRRYQKLYNKLARNQNRIDEVAIFMGWDTNADPQDQEVADNGIEAFSDQPYTLHKHPLYIASKALHNCLTERWSQHVSLCSEQISPVSALKIQKTISSSEQYGLLAVTALDLGDYALAIAYCKRGLSQINKLLSQLNEFETKNIAPLNAFSKHAKIRLFDIREIWLRVMSDCRTAVARRFEEE
tara:strand:- start:193 stop:855 length:663 start_codon:yes stop_codon:yes gene_type:complete